MQRNTETKDPQFFNHSHSVNKSLWYIHVPDCVFILPGGGAVWDEAERVGYTVYCGRG